MKKELKFEGFEYKIPPKDLIYNFNNLQIHDDGSASTGDVYKSEIELNEEIQKIEKDIFSILKECE